MLYHVLEKTVHVVYTKRSQLDNKEITWKHDSITPSLDDARYTTVDLGSTIPVAK
jgi:hypothetical protein